MGSIILSGSVIHPIVADPSRTNILINNKGKIWQVGDEIRASKARIIELERNWHITPALIDAHSHIGLSGYYGQDECNDDSEPISPALSIIDSYNIFSEEIPLALESGVGASCIMPGSGSIIGGQCAVVKMYGSSLDEILVRSPVGIKAAIDDNSSYSAEYDQENNYTKMGITSKVRDFFLRLKYYMKSTKRDMNLSDLNIHFDVMKSIIENELPFRIHCHVPSDIETAIRLFYDELNCNVILEHATYADKVLDIISSRDIPVVYGPYPMSLRGADRSPVNKAAPAILEAAGVKVAFMTDHDIMPAWGLQLAACEAVKHGMSKTGALRALTLNAAEICGVEDRLGSIVRGRDADLVIWDKHPLNFYSTPLGVIIDGKFRYVRKNSKLESILEKTINE